MRIVYLLAAASVWTLSACGGGSTPSSGPSTPTPTPAPTPTPTPQPTTSYVVTDYSSDFSLVSSLGYMTNYSGEFPQYFVSGALLAPEKRSTLYYYRNPERVDFSYDGSSVSLVTADRTSGPPNLVFQKQGELVAPGLIGNTPTQYVTTVLWRTATAVTDASGASSPGYRHRIAFFGTPSDTNDTLSTFLGYSGVAKVSGGIAGSQSQSALDVSAGSSNIQWSYSPSTNGLSGSIPLFIHENASQIQRGLLIASGQFNPMTNSISGTLRDPIAGFQGTFHGQMFGPNRVELAIVFEFSRSSDASVYFGHYIGVR